MSGNTTRVVPANSRGGVVLLNDDYRLIVTFVIGKVVRTNYGGVHVCTLTGCGSHSNTNLFDVTEENATINGMHTLCFIY